MMKKESSDKLVIYGCDVLSLWTILFEKFYEDEFVLLL